jgi:hypothetical protein
MILLSPAREIELAVTLNYSSLVKVSTTQAASVTYMRTVLAACIEVENISRR